MFINYAYCAEFSLKKLLPILPSLNEENDMEELKAISRALAPDKRWGKTLGFYYVVESSKKHKDMSVYWDDFSKEYKVYFSSEKDLLERIKPLWFKYISPDLRATFLIEALTLGLDLGPLTKA